MPVEQCSQSSPSVQQATFSGEPTQTLSSGGGEEVTESPTVETIPDERTGDTEVVAQGEEAATLRLARGQYRATFIVPASIKEAQSIKGQTKRLKIEDEMKRLHFYKVDAVPTGKKSDDGEPLVKVTAVFRVIDNPIPLVPIAWGAAGLLGVGGGGWLLFSSAESFVEDTQWPILTGAAAILSIMVGYHTLWG